MTQEVILKLRIQMPEEMYVKDLKKYIEDAIIGWSGQFHPEHPLFGHFHEDGNLVITTYRRSV